MLRPVLLVLFYLAQLVQGTSTNTTSSSSPPPDGTTRSLWSILGSCALTLVICVWHAIHFDVLQDGWATTLLVKGLCVVGSFVAPEVMVAVAAAEWKNSRDQVKRFNTRGYGWSMTHSFFAQMGGFVYRDDKGDSRTIGSLEFLDLCEANKIANPVLTVKEIKDKSKSDALGKAILILQLFWFMLQAIVRSSEGLAVTLVELDTVCMAVLSVFVFCLWWDKPLRPGCPHIFYSPHAAKADSPLKKAWKPEPSYLSALTACFSCTRKTQSITDDEEMALMGTNEKPTRPNIGLLVGDKIEDDFGIQTASFCVTWMILGVLHLTAWNFEFPTETEKILWRVASLVLAGGPIVFIIILAVYGLSTGLAEIVSGTIVYLACILGVVSRMLLVGLMLSSLRALPPSAYQTVSWTAYIPHL